MTLPASACEEVGRVSWPLKKDYYYTTEIQSWYAKMGVCVLAGVDYWTHIYAIKLWRLLFGVPSYIPQKYTN